MLASVQRRKLYSLGLQDKEKFYQAGGISSKKGKTPGTCKRLQTFPHTGSPNVLVALVDFADFKFKNSDEENGCNI